MKELKAKKLVLKQKREALEKKLKEAKGRGGTHDDDDRDDSAPQDLVWDSFQREEFEQAIHFHMEELERKEKDLQKEEESLRWEKAAHLKELRRVKNEDASRFKNRPKVCIILYCVFKFCL